MLRTSGEKEFQQAKGKKKRKRKKERKTKMNSPSLHESS
jgi:hypothetical protein